MTAADRYRELPDGQIQRRCTKCTEYKLLRCFAPQKRGPDGFASWCRVCVNHGRTQKARPGYLNFLSTYE